MTTLVRAALSGATPLAFVSADALLIVAAGLAALGAALTVALALRARRRGAEPSEPPASTSAVTVEPRDGRRPDRRRHRGRHGAESAGRRVTGRRPVEPLEGPAPGLVQRSMSTSTAELAAAISSASPPATPSRRAGTPRQRARRAAVRSRRPARPRPPGRPARRRARPSAASVSSIDARAASGRDRHARQRHRQAADRDVVRAR